MPNDKDLIFELAQDNFGTRQDFDKLLSEPRQPKRPALWDGHAAERCLDARQYHRQSVCQ